MALWTADYVESIPTHNTSQYRPNPFMAEHQCSVQQFTTDVLAGLAFLHRRNIVHRDIKVSRASIPQKQFQPFCSLTCARSLSFCQGAIILIDHTGTCKLADFGGAREFMNSASGNAAKSIHGTINWMAPQVITQAGHDKAADVWRYDVSSIII